MTPLIIQMRHSVYSQALFFVYSSLLISLIRLKSLALRFIFQQLSIDVSHHVAETIFHFAPGPVFNPTTTSFSRDNR